MFEMPLQSFKYLQNTKYLNLLSIYKIGFGLVSVGYDFFFKIDQLSTFRFGIALGLMYVLETPIIKLKSIRF